MGEFIFKEPSLNDFEAVQDVFKDVWDMNIMREIFASQIYGKEAAIICAYREEEIVGVISSFMSVNNRGKKRWEIDLMAVKKNMQGKGLGTELIKASLEKGKEYGAVYARGLVRIENPSSQKAFLKAGLTKNEGILSLLLWQPWITKKRIKKVNDITYLPMDTLTYRGLWIEDLFAKERTSSEYLKAINYAQQLVYDERRDNTGATILKEDMNKLPKSILKQSANHGKYNWWTIDL